jgi:hypothetical protein
MAERKPSIKFTAREFETIKQQLVEYGKKHHPNIFKDDSPNNFGSMILDSVAYIGDQLSLLSDFNFNESFLDSSVVFENILKHARSKGLQFNTNPSSFGTAQFYVQVPVDSTGTQPDPLYRPVLKRGSQVASTAGVGFILNEDVDFSNPSTLAAVSQINDTTGQPTFFAVKGEGYVISGEIRRETISVGSFVPFLRLTLGNPNITEVLSIIDSEGKSYYETSNLSQDVVYRSVVNRDANTSEQVVNILKPFPVPRRFVVERDGPRTTLVFGHGTELGLDEANPVDPSNVLFQMNGREFITDESFDPTKLIRNDKFGIAPSNTTLTITYRANTNSTVNVSSGELRQVARPIFDFKSNDQLNNTKRAAVIGSLEVNNAAPIIGDVTFPTNQELKRFIVDYQAAQNRAVTKRDHVAMTYAMPGEFGRVKRASVVQDRNSFKRNLNLYVISENAQGQLTTANLPLKNNLKVWLSRVKMINDTISILDANIVNLGIEFTVVGETGKNKTAIRNKCNIALRQLFATKMDIGEPFSISSVYSALNKVDGVTDTVDVKVVRKTGGNYSDTRFNIDQNLSADGRLLFAPEDVVFEIRSFASDVKGVVR